MAQLSYVCKWFAFQIGALGMDFDHRYGIWLGWGLKPGTLRRFAKKWDHEWMRTI
jgi:hypothetical protein